MQGYVYPGSIIGYGSTGENVVKIQKRLNELGYNVGVADGIFGNGTKTAVQNFQTRHGLTSDGMVGRGTWTELFSTVAIPNSLTSYPGVLICKGSTGSDVTNIQNKLQHYGYDPGTPDGVFGGATERAVIYFQKRNGLTPDGFVGRDTWDVLFSGCYVISIGKYEYPGYDITIGVTGPAVEKVQTRLNELGYDAGVADGIYGQGSRTAVGNFQTKNSIQVDEIIDRDCWNLLFSSNALSQDSINYPSILLGYGSSGQDVETLQTRLNDLGYNLGIVDGEFGGATERAVKRFQSKNGLDIDGLVGRGTWVKLFSSSAIPLLEEDFPGYLIGVGSRGDDVKRVQERLNLLKFNAGIADGIFGSGTQSAVQRFQLKNNLAADGLIGQTSWDVLFSDYAIAAEVVYNPNIKKIFIDAGHGGTDPGAIGNNLNEKDLTLSLSLKQKSLLENAGYTVLLSRSTDTSVPLQERTDAANNWGADLFISNHVNACGTSTVRGVEVWHSLIKESSYSYAERVCNALAEIFDRNRGAKARLNTDGLDYLHVLRESNMPAILIEHGFITNTSDTTLLSQDAELDKMASATVNAIINNNVFLDDENVIKLGESSSDVKELQYKLCTLNYLSPLYINGYFGMDTEAAVRAFQNQMGFNNTGMISSDVRTAIETEYNTNHANNKLFCINEISKLLNISVSTSSSEFTSTKIIAPGFTLTYSVGGSYTIGDNPYLSVNVQNGEFTKSISAELKDLCSEINLDNFAEIDNLDTLMSNLSLAISQGNVTMELGGKVIGGTGLPILTVIIEQIVPDEIGGTITVMHKIVLEKTLDINYGEEEPQPILDGLSSTNVIPLVFVALITMVGISGLKQNKLGYIAMSAMYAVVATVSVSVKSISDKIKDKFNL